MQEPRLGPGEYLGQGSRAWTFDRFSMTERRYDATTRLGRHAHACPHVCVVLDGHYEERVGRHSGLRSPGSVLFLPADCAHAEQHRTAGRHVMVEFDAAQIDALGGARRLPGDPATLSSPATAALVWRLRQELRARADVAAVVLEGLALELIGALTRQLPERHRPAWLATVDAIIEQHHAERLTLMRVARAVNVHPTHLARSYRVHMHCTIGDRVRQRRVEAAARMLTGTDMRLADIAHACGFADQSHLTRTFRTMVGIPPARHRALVRANSVQGPR